MSCTQSSHYPALHGGRRRRPPTPPAFLVSPQRPAATDDRRGLGRAHRATVGVSWPTPRTMMFEPAEIGQSLVSLQSPLTVCGISRALQMSA